MSKQNIRDDFSYYVKRNEALKAAHEASLSVACLLNDVSSMWVRDKYDFAEQEQLQNKIENIQNQMATIETYLERFDH